MIKSSKILSLILFFTLLSTYSPNYESNQKNFFFPIKNIEIENNKVIKKTFLRIELNDLMGKNLLFVKTKFIKSTILKLDFISSFKIKKIYPNTIKIIITEKLPVATYNDGKQISYLTKKGELISYVKLENFSNLPVVIGKNFNFKKIYQILENSKFPINQIKSLHYFDIGRWDINLRKDILLKLPKEDYNGVLENFMNIKDNKSFENYKIFDYRIKNQLILK